MSRSLIENFPNHVTPEDFRNAQDLKNDVYSAPITYKYSPKQSNNDDFIDPKLNNLHELIKIALSMEYEENQSINSLSLNSNCSNYEYNETGNCKYSKQSYMANRLISVLPQHENSYIYLNNKTDQREYNNDHKNLQNSICSEIGQIKHMNDNLVQQSFNGDNSSFNFGYISDMNGQGPHLGTQISSCVQMYPPFINDMNSNEIQSSLTKTNGRAKYTKQDTKNIALDPRAY